VSRGALSLESVPNVAEGCDLAAIDEIGSAFSRRATVIDVHSDPDHHRSVYTLVAPDDGSLVEAVAEGVAAAVARLDLRRHTGVHPRVGVADVIPFVPLRPGDMPRAEAAALALARRVGDDLGVPVFLYGAVGEGRRPAFFRRGGPSELARRIATGELDPAFGPRRLHPSAGAALVGARAPLVAFNVELATADIEIARAVAAAVRASDGGMEGVQAIGLFLAQTGNAQVSTNVIDVDVAPLHLLVERIRLEAAARGVELVRGELVGLVPARVVQRAAGSSEAEFPDAAALAAAAAAFALEELTPEMVLELRLHAAGLL
jgi:glutamate formiminotransferase